MVIWSLGWAAGSAAKVVPSPGHWLEASVLLCMGFCKTCLSILMAWQLASPREGSRASTVTDDLVSAATHHHSAHSTGHTGRRQLSGQESFTRLRFWGHRDAWQASHHPKVTQLTSNQGVYMLLLLCFFLWRHF